MGGTLHSIRNPRDLKQLPLVRLPDVGAELRDAITERFALRRDYLASALGMADLTTALHYVFDFSHDRLVFDLAHQAAAHLVLTRRDLATADDSARIEGAFPGDEREPWDQFFSCHAGASISKALGLAAGDGQGRKTVAVIGDGAVVSGIALEALNSGQGFDRDLLVVLNDNEMSVSKVVGALGEMLSKIRVGKAYNELKKEAHKLVQAIPFIGEKFDKAAEQMRDAVAKALVPGALFERMGPRYFGPVDGHNVSHLVQLLQEIKRQPGFYLLHVITRREEPAKTEREGESIIVRRSLALEPDFERQGEENWNALLATAVEDRLRSDPRVCVLTLVTPEMESLGGFATSVQDRFPGRVWNMKVNEQHGVAFAAGLARAGRRPIVVSPTALFHRAHDQVAQEVGSRGLPVVFALAYAGLVSSETTVDHGVDDIAFLRGVPGLDLMAPRDGDELSGMLALALDQEGPAAIRVPHAFAASRNDRIEERAELARGCPETLRRGSDLAVLALGSLVYPALEAAELLAQKGVEASVINARFVRPLDLDFVARLLSEHSLLFVAEEHRLAGGFAASILESAAVERLAADRIVPIALSAGPLSRGLRSELLRRHGLDPAGLADRMLHAYRRWVRS
ncbi:MAG: 1-deoxy-D-xylulose-5-phosphate synthase [Planctomycetes bacterium]|nr:1-deoxy-D-xylulose-5-phosphate synthase [Planctomycetota bacterium]